MVSPHAASSCWDPGDRAGSSAHCTKAVLTTWLYGGFFPVAEVTVSLLLVFLSVSVSFLLSVCFIFDF